MVLQKGDFILIEYTAKVKETMKFLILLVKKLRRRSIFKEGEISSRNSCNWRGLDVKTLDENSQVWQLAKLQLLRFPDKAFGARDPEKVKRVPLKQLLAKGINPVIGMRTSMAEKTLLYVQ